MCLTHTESNLQLTLKSTIVIVVCEAVRGGGTSHTCTRNAMPCRARLQQGCLAVPGLSRGALPCQASAGVPCCARPQQRCLAMPGLSRDALPCQASAEVPCRARPQQRCLAVPGISRGGTPWTQHTSSTLLQGGINSLLG